MSVVQWTALYDRLEAIERRLTALENRGDIIVPPDIEVIKSIVFEYVGPPQELAVLGGVSWDKPKRGRPRKEPVNG